MPHDLAHVAAAGAGVTTVAQLVRVAVQATGIVLLSRLLSPSDFGLMAIVATVVAFGEIVREFGLSVAAVQATELTRHQRTNLHWWNATLGVVLAGVAVAVAEPVAALFGYPELAGMMRWLAATLVLNGWATQYRASLARDMRFASVAGVDTAALVLGLVIGVGCALAGWGYWSLVAMEVAKAAFLCAGVVYLGRWWPGRYDRGARMARLLTFGWHVLATQVLGFVSRNVDTLIVGLRFGAVSSGLYTRAFQLMALPVTQLSYPAAKVALPVLSRLQDDGPRYERYVARGQTVLLHCLVPVMVVVAVVPGAVVGVVLGAQWEGVTPILQILALGGIFEAANFGTGWVLQSVGATGQLLQYSLVVKPLMIVLIVLGSMWGVTGVAAGYAIGTALTWPMGLLWVRRVRPRVARILMANSVVVIGGYLGAGIVTLAIVRLWSPDAPWAELLAGSLVMAAASGLVALMWRRWRRGWREAFGTVRLLRARGARP